MSVLALREIKARAEWQFRRALLGVLAAILLSVGAGFLVAAIWMMIAAEFSPIIATLACSSLFLGAGVVTLLLRGGPRKPVSHARADASKPQARGSAAHAQTGALKEYPALFEAFLFGLSTYERVRRERERK